MPVPTDSLDSIYERSTGAFSTTKIRDLPPKTLNHFHTLKTLKIEINVKLIKCPSAPTRDWFPDPVNAKVPYTHGGALHTTHAVFKAPSRRCKCRVAAQYCSGNKDKNKTVHIQYRDSKICHQELGESTDVEPSHKSLLSLFLHAFINVNMLQ